MGTFSAIIIEEQPRKKVCLSFLLYTFGLMASCVSQKLNVKLLYTYRPRNHSIEQHYNMFKLIQTRLNSFRILQTCSNYSMMVVDPLMLNKIWPHDKQTLLKVSSISVRHPVVYWTEAPALREAKCTDIIQFKPLPLTSPQHNQNFPRGPFFVIVKICCYLI